MMLSDEKIKKPKNTREYIERLFDVSITDDDQTRELHKAIENIESYDVKLGILQIKNKIDNIKTDQEDLKKTLYGNGRPGLVTQFQWVKGGLSVVGFLVATFGVFLLTELLA